MGQHERGKNVPYDLKIDSKQQEGNGTSRQLCFGDERKLSACDLNTADLHAKLVEMGAPSRSL